ncbi:5068_t:CDS:1, partial [Paraglomus occultum]
TCRAITLLPDEVLMKLEKEEKIKPKQRLKPIIQVNAAYPKKWETRGILQARKWTPKAELPTPVHQGFILYSNEDMLICGQEYIPTGIEIKVPEGMSAMVSSLDNTSSYIVPATLIQTHGRIKVPVISTYGARISAKQPIAKLTFLPIAGAQLVAAGQQKESKPSPFTKNLTPDQDAQVQALVKEYDDIFAEDLIELGQTTHIKHQIPTQPGAVAYSKRYRQSWENEDFITAEVER